MLFACECYGYYDVSIYDITTCNLGNASWDAENVGPNVGSGKCRTWKCETKCQGCKIQEHLGCWFHYSHAVLKCVSRLGFKDYQNCDDIKDSIQYSLHPCCLPPISWLVTKRFLRPSTMRCRWFGSHSCHDLHRLVEHVWQMRSLIQSHAGLMVWLWCHAPGHSHFCAGCTDIVQAFILSGQWRFCNCSYSYSKNWLTCLLSYSGSL